MESLEADIEMAPEEEAEAEDSSEDREERQALHEDRHPLDRGEEDIDGSSGTVELDSDEDENVLDEETATVGENS